MVFFREKQERKNAENIKRIIDVSNVSSNSAKSNVFSSQTLFKQKGRSSTNASDLQTEEAKVVKKGILKSRMSSSCSSLTIPEHHAKQPNTGQKRFSSSKQNAENSYRSLKTEWEKSSCRPAKMISSESYQSSKHLNTRPIVSFKNNQRVQTNTKQKTAVSEHIVSNGQDTQIPDQGNLKTKLVDKHPINGPQKDEQNTCNVISRRTPKCHQICFKSSIGGTADWEHRLREEDATQAPATILTPIRLTECSEDCSSSDSAPVAKHGSSFLYDVCQEMDQESHSDLMTNSPETIDGNGANQTRCCLLNALYSLSDSEDQNTAEDSTSGLDIIPGKPFDQQESSFPLVAPGHCRCSELLIDCVHEDVKEEVPARSPVTATAISEKLPEKEFSVSSASSSLSAPSLISLHEQMVKSLRYAIS